MRFVAVLTAAVLGLALLYALQALVVQVIIAITIASGLGPLVDRLERARLSRGIAVLVIYAVALLGVLVVGLIVVPPFVRQVQEAIQNLPAYSEALDRALASLGIPGVSGIGGQLGEAVRGLGGQQGGGQGAVVGQGLGVLSAGLGALGGIFAIGLILIMAVNFAVDGGRMRDYGLSFLPVERRPRVREVIDLMGRRMGDWFVGQALLSGIAGVTTFVALLILGFGFPNALLFGFLAALGQVVPMIGPVIVAIPAVIVGFFIGTIQGIATVAFYFAFIQVENAILVPKLFGEGLHLHPLIVLLALIVGAALLGVVGSIVALPVAAALAVLLDRFRKEPTPHLAKVVAKVE